MLPTDIMSSQLLSIYSDLVNGKVLTKAELAQRFHVTERSIQRDVESLRLFLSAARFIVHDRFFSPFVSAFLPLLRPPQALPPDRQPPRRGAGTAG